MFDPLTDGRLDLCQDRLGTGPVVNGKVHIQDDAVGFLVDFLTDHTFNPVDLNGQKGHQILHGLVRHGVAAQS